MGCLCCCDHLFICGIQTSVTDIFHNGSRKQPGILKHHSKHLSQTASVKVFDVITVYLNTSAIEIIESHKQFHHSCLSCTCGTYNGNLLTILHICGEVIDNDLIRIVAEFYMFKLNISCKCINIYRVLLILALFRLLQEFKYALGSCSRGL